MPASRTVRSVRRLVESSVANRIPATLGNGVHARRIAAVAACTLVCSLPAVADAAMPALPQAPSSASVAAPHHAAVPVAQARSAAQAAASFLAPMTAAALDRVQTLQQVAADRTMRSSAAASAAAAKRTHSATAAATRSAARTPKPRAHPGWVTAGHYIRSLTGRASDVRIMRALGAQDATANPGGIAHLVLLDIGGQVHDGVNLSTMSRFISYRQLVRALGAYLDGYHSRERAGAVVTVAVGTNNDLAVDRGTGRAWARQLINPLRAHAAHYSHITVVGADDIEPGFRAGPAETQQWLAGYLANTSAAFVFNGSADGCSSVHSVSPCGGSWSSRDLVRFAGAMAPGRTIVLPQIYNSTMAAQWAQLSRAAVQAVHRPLPIVGVLTENRACGSDPSCPTMPNWQATRRLMARLRGVHLAPADLPYQVDLDVH